MKPVIFAAMLMLVCGLCSAQNKGSITPENTTPKAGEENFYLYQPAPGLAMPAALQASIVYIYKGYYNKFVPLVKSGNGYRFSFKTPDSASAMVICIVDDKKAMFDNNNETGYVTYLYDKTGKRFENAGVTAAEILGGYGPYVFKFSTPTATVIKLYEDEYKAHPSLKKEGYVGYLQILYGQKKDTVKPQMIAYAKQVLAEKADEKQWINAVTVYRILKMDSARKVAEKKILAAYPTGSLAKDNFWNAIYADKEPTPAKRLAAMHEYFAKFKDSSTTIKDNFYSGIISLYAEKKDWDNVEKYDKLVTNKVSLVGIYNNLAWGLSGEQLDNEGSNLDYARVLSQRTLAAVQSKIDDPALSADDKQQWKVSYDMYADTYALILYKEKKYDSAFYYQDAIQQKGQDDVSGIERYAAYAEKAKGAAFAKDFIEGKLLTGINSPAMQKQLQSIYKQLNLPEDAYNAIKAKSVAMAKQKTAEAIKAIFGTTEGKDFELKDLEGNTVTLASLKNKVVILDFWATWCGPCRASFPAMQEAVTKYKDDKDVVFLFVDVFEDGDAQTIKQNTAAFIKNSKYTFRVLVDDKNKTAGDYKVEAIPDKFVLDRNGNIVMMGHEINDIAAVIESAKG